MLNLFTINEDWRLEVLPETLSIKAFNDVLNKYKKREVGIAELTYVYFMVDFRSDFKDIINHETKSETILSNIVYGNEVKVDKVTKAAMDFYKERQPSISLRHLEAMEFALDNLQRALRDIDMTKTFVNEEGENVEMYDTLALNRIMGIIKESPKIISAIKEMEKQVKTELQENDSHRGSGNKSIYEDDD